MQEPWKRNWRMYAYLTEELPLVLRELPALDVHTVRLCLPYPQNLSSCERLASNAHAAYEELSLFVLAVRHI